MFSENHCDQFGCHFREGVCQPGLVTGLKGENRRRAHVFGVTVGQVYADRHLLIFPWMASPF